MSAIRLEKILALAQNPGSPAEGATALKMAKRLWLQNPSIRWDNPFGKGTREFIYKGLSKIPEDEIDSVQVRWWLSLCDIDEVAAVLTRLKSEKKSKHIRALVEAALDEALAA